MKVERIINSPLPSNAYVIWNESNRQCIIIDPGTPHPYKIIDLCDKFNLKPEAIILTHFHFDHVWGANCLREKYDCSIICSQRCAEKLMIPQNYFNLLYFNDESMFSIENIDVIINDNIEVAVKVNADGIHIGQSDISCLEARNILGIEKIIGVTVSNLKEAKEAISNGASYLGVGAIYKSRTKSEAIIQPAAIIGSSKLAKRKPWQWFKIIVRFLPAIYPADYAGLTTHEIGYKVIDMVNKEFPHEKKFQIEESNEL